MEKFIKKYKIPIKLFLLLCLGIVILATTFYFLIPAILTYPEGTYATSFQHELENTDYNMQALAMAFAIFVLFAIVTFSKTYFLIEYADVIENPQKYNETKINLLKEKLYTTPYSMYILNIICPTLAITIIHAFTIHQLGITTLKIFILMFSFITVYVSMVFLYSKKLFKNIIVSLPLTDMSGFKKTSLKSTIFYHILPLILVSLLFTSLIGYSRLTYEKGNAIFEAYHEKLKVLSTKTYYSYDELVESLNNIELINNSDIIFIKDEDKFYDLDGNEINFSDFVKKYLNELSPSNNGRFYEYYGIDSQGASTEVKIGRNSYIVGVYYNISSPEILYYFVISFVILLLTNLLVLTLFSSSLSSDIKQIAKRFFDMARSKKGIVTEKLPVPTNDEIGDLCIAYNELQDLNNKNLEQLKSSQDLLVERERLASLGQMIGGIAHNLKTPIMSISGASEGLSDLTKELDMSIGNPQVTEEDYHAIVKDMNEWIEKIKTHTSYMSDVITAVKGQAVVFSEDQIYPFTIEELFNRVEILMRHELKNSITKLTIDDKTTKDDLIHGNINSLVQILNNMISNSIQAYNNPNKEKEINLSAKVENSRIIISIQDFGPGIPKDVQERLFKEMVTTKGKEGTGLGLFMSYSNIKAHFHGNITFETSSNGTTFKISLPIYKN